MNDLLATDIYLNHIKNRDTQAAASMAALTDFFDQQLLNSNIDSMAEWDEVLFKVISFVGSNPDYADLVFALGRSHDVRIKPMLYSLIESFVEYASREEIVWQALVALSNFDVVSQYALESILLSTTSLRIRQLAEDQLVMSFR
jgi:hypothetical protein